VNEKAPRTAEAESGWLRRGMGSAVVNLELKSLGWICEVAGIKDMVVSRSFAHTFSVFWHPNLSSSLMFYNSCRYRRVKIYDIVAYIYRPLLTHWHILNFVAQGFPIINLHLCILHPLLTPVIVQPRNTILRALEGLNFVADALFDEHTSCVLVDNGLFVLQYLVLVAVDVRRIENV